MTDTIADVLVPTNEYVDLNVLSGIPAGTALIITNKSLDWGLLQIGLTKPLALSSDGEPICTLPDATAIKFIGAGEATVWARSTGTSPLKLSVQDNT